MTGSEAVAFGVCDWRCTCHGGCENKEAEEDEEEQEGGVKEGEERR